MPQSFSFKAQSTAPENAGWIFAGNRAARYKLEKSFKCYGRRPSGPPADPGLKDFQDSPQNVGFKHRDTCFTGGLSQVLCELGDSYAILLPYSSSNGNMMSSLAANNQMAR